MSADEVIAVLERRARQLAKAPDELPPTVEVLVMTVGEIHYAFETRHVREVLRTERVRRLPAGASALRGLVAARGEVVPVADLGELLGAPAAAAASRSCVVVIDGSAPPVGLLVDEASDVVDVAADRLAAVSGDAASGNGPSRLALGVAPDGTVVLDASAFLDDPRLVVPRRSPTSPNHSRQET